MSRRTFIGSFVSAITGAASGLALGWHARGNGKESTLPQGSALSRTSAEVDGAIKTDLPPPGTGAAADLPDWRRLPLGASRRSLQRALDAQEVNIWELEHLVTDRPSDDPSQWDWSPAFSALVSSGRRGFLPYQSKYRLGSPVAASGKSGLRLIAEPGTVVDASEINSGLAALSYTGSLTRLPNLATSASRGTTKISFVSAHGLQSGDVFCLWSPDGRSFSSFRKYYHAGEWCRVAYVINRTEIRVERQLYDSYDASEVEVHQMVSGPIHLENVKVIGKGTTDSIRIELASGGKIVGVSAVHQNDTALRLDRCFDFDISGSSAINYGTDGDDYGLAIHNCQSIRTRGGSFYARRHGVTYGGRNIVGAVPTRDCRTIGATIANDTYGSRTFAADFHGNSEDCWYIECNISGGGTLQGKNVGIRNSRITSMANGTCVYAAEIAGGNYTLDGNDYITEIDPHSSNRGIIDFGGNSQAINANTAAPIHIIITGGTVNGTNLSAATSFLVVRNRGTTQPISVTIDGISINVDAIGQILHTALDAGIAASNGFVIDKLSGNLPPGVHLHKSLSSAYVNFPHRLPTLTGSYRPTPTSKGPLIQAPEFVYRYIYPRKPNVLVTVTEGPHSRTCLQAGADAVSASSLMVWVATVDGSNIPADQSITIDYLVTIHEI